MAHDGQALTAGDQLLADQGNWFNQTPYAAQGRLTLLSGDPVTTTDITGAETIYFTPYRGNRCAVYDGSAEWDVLEFSELSLTTTDGTTDLPYDIFAFNDSGSLNIEKLAWSDRITRATALATQDGVLVKTGATTRRFLGSILISSTGGMVDDSLAFRGVWNMYNQEFREFHVLEDTNHTYNGALRKWNNTDAARVDFMVGLDRFVQGDIKNSTTKSGADGNFAQVGIDIDAAVARDGNLGQTSNYNDQLIKMGAPGAQLIPEGAHYFQVIESGDHASSTFTQVRIGGGMWA